jgi:hypothetical protein
MIYVGGGAIGSYLELLSKNELGATGIILEYTFSYVEVSIGEVAMSRGALVVAII